MKKKFIIVLIVIITIGLGIFIFFVNNGIDTRKGASEAIKEAKAENDLDLVQAIENGSDIDSSECKGSGPRTLTHLPMDPEDFSIVIPYGLMVGGHVTPIDHQYFAPADYNSKRDVYEVYAMGDGAIVDISARPRTSMTDPNDKFEEYRIIFTHSCTFYTYYDLVTSLAPDLKAEYDKKKSENGYASDINYAVNAGDLIGYIGGQTLDFAVWDTEKTLNGFITPELYKGESWKIYTANPYDYYSDEIKELLTERNPRTIAPIEGKIDYDIDGKLIGNWFVEGTGGYNDGGNGEYWKTHLSFAPDHYDPDHFIASIGNFDGQASQFALKDNTPLPSEVGINSGLVKYDLLNFGYKDSEGNEWRGMSIIKNPKFFEKHNEGIKGCVLVQMTAKNRLKFEAFPKKSCELVEGFSGNEKIYER